MAGGWVAKGQGTDGLGQSFREGFGPDEQVLVLYRTSITYRDANRMRLPAHLRASNV